MLRLPAVALAATIAFANPVLAQPGPPPGGPPLFLSPGGEPFRTGDGLGAWFDGADADHDGVLVLAEFRADAMRFFKVLDLNADGWVDGAENSNYERVIAPEITRLALGGPGGGPRGGPRPERPMISKAGKRPEPRQGAAQYSLLNEPQPVRGADFDLNQRVSAEEWAKAAGRRFGLLDRDGDSKLTLATLAPRRP